MNTFPKSRRLVWKRILTYQAGLIFFGFVIFVLIIATIYGFKTGSFDFLLNALMGIGFVIVLLAVILYLPLYLINRVTLKSANFHFTNEGINIEDNSFSSYKVFIPFSSVQSVALWQEFWDKKFNIYNVVISTPAYGGQHMLRGFDENVAKSLMNRIVESSRNTSPNKILEQASSASSEQKFIIKSKLSEQPISSNQFPIDKKIVIFNIFSGLKYAFGVYLLSWLVLLVVFPINEIFFHFTLTNEPIVILQGSVAFLAFLFKLYELTRAQKNFFFELNKHDMTIRSGTYKIQEEKFPYKIIQEVSTGQDWIQHILKLSSILIKTTELQQTPAGEKLVTGWIILPSLQDKHAEMVLNELKRIIG